MSPDRYIRLATAGMPRRQRLEQASEIRSNLLAHVARLTAEGYAREEAEHLALDELGPAASINRGYWRAVVDTLGWTLLWPLLLGVVALVSWWYLIPTPTGVKPFDPGGLAWSRGYRLTLPKGTQAAHVAIVRHDGYLMTSLYPAASFGGTNQRPTYRDRLTIVGGVQAADPDASCYQQIEVLITLGQGTERSCLTTERRSDGPNRAFDSLTWVGPARGPAKLEAGRWVPIGAFQVEHWLPEVPFMQRIAGDTFERIPFEWVGIMLYLGTDEPPTDPPRMTELSRYFPDLRTFERVP